MKKVGLATCFLDNYGACLQAYALSKTIENLQNECVIFNYTEVTGYYDDTLKERFKNSFIYNSVRSMLSEKYKESYKLGKCRRKAFNNFRKQYLPISKEHYNEHSDISDLGFDAVVCGSDQVWNPTFYDACNPFYYLTFAKGLPKIAYAPSIGVSDIPEPYVKEFKEYLSDFKAISVREQNAVDLVKKYADRDSKWVLDPTMLLDGDKWSELTKASLVKKPYIFCYLFGRQEYYTKSIEYLKKKTGLDVVIIPFSERDLNNDYKKICNAGPLEFITLIKNAQYVLTDSFHATVFSILFGKQFFTLLRDAENEQKSMNSRIHSLLSMIDKKDRCVTENNAQNFAIDPITDYERVHECLENLRNDSLSFLKTALEDK